MGKNVTLTIRLSTAEKESLQAMARQDNRSIANYVLWLHKLHKKNREGVKHGVQTTDSR